ncbi:spermidine synthase [Aestuariivirga sp.]|uniref:spermidine synthase n=1 Tax=Aestuariivirga sp. TaxID=2650926 RepID=UPI00391A7F5A
MSALFEELDYQPTPIGALSLRRRRELRLGVDVIEIKLGEHFLMSSLFTESEVELARRSLSLLDATAIDVMVGGLGLGYTAAAVLEDPRVASLTVCEMLEPVIEWHRSGLLPLGPVLTGDKRCRFVHGDFFAMSASDTGFDPRQSRRRFDAILVDIDHSPDELLDQRSASFYQTEGLSRLASHLQPGGVFGLWSNAPPEASFTRRLAEVFADARAIPVTFRNPLQDNLSTQTVYVGRLPSAV